MSGWKEEAKQYWLDGVSQRKISKLLGVPRTTVGDYIRRMGCVPYESSPAVGPKILFIDIETKPILAQVWRLWDQNVGLNQIEQDWSILSFCAKWKGCEDVVYMDLKDQDDFEDDSTLLDSLWRLLNEADFVVGQNSKRFDVKKINARFILNGMPKPSTFRQIDTMEIAKRQFGFTSNKLAYMTDKLCTVYKKLDHQKFSGHSLWAECLKGNPEAWAEMKEYNIYDVLSLEELYDILSSWDDKLPNFDVYVDGVLDMSEWQVDGFHYSNLGKYKRYRNTRTGEQRRSRVNTLSKEKRESLLRNI
ncbi:putative exonuclease [Pseudomonas phage vB_PsyM_KIL3b]|uniref:Putative exonuclease n=5 Tax=Flaumdravirus TaxID=2560133 RepID=A0A142IE66_9CAUD|nr:DNA polymerase exonuclease subunit [Pseudomonas phage vB_PsyM_KIL1]YP_009616795.1 DNA polymerase exonuclease subunit [Pseudomonas phage vB_PsyM_KIL4]AMR57521.1 putative exonuclease [Pseudomonas phage vB_PsyM_KIL2]AMR57683.1 putative exonuclease [Pseudomonas phage vB_PsyM_KIL3]AMR58181.1 putative exonuclease [Pseudomonas phage vB_PsyM_KIL3b]AMR57362.1 putative exonuclease [Pseudomonas phage vB_PsyM_KIL1]AMR57842.1 putative exonuclease [Pseudomonas phage vB_PsyM_KIL4]